MTHMDKTKSAFDEAKTKPAKGYVTVSIHFDEDTGIPEIGVYGPFATKREAEADVRSMKGFAKYCVSRRIVSPDEYRDDG